MLRGVLALVCFSFVGLLVPSVAGADLTISTSASSNVQLSGFDDCTFQASAAVANVDVSDVDSCLEADAPVLVQDNVSGGGDVIVSAPISPSSCGSLSVDDGVGSITLNGGIDLAGAGCGVSLTADDAITGNAGVITPSLTTSSGASTTLGTSNAVSDDVTDFQATATDGSVALQDSNPGALELNGVRATAGFQIVNGGDIYVNDPLAAGADQAATLDSTDGGIIQPGGNQFGGPDITAGELAVNGDSAGGSTTPDAGTITLSAANTIGALYANANYGIVDITSLSGSGMVQLVGLHAGEAIIVTDPAGALETAGPISAGSGINLEGNGFITAGGTATASTLGIIDNDPSESWSVTPTTISTGGQALTYSGVSGLNISGGSTFNVTPSPLTAISLGATAGTLTYNAGGKPAALSSQSGAISQAGMQLVKYTGMTNVYTENTEDPNLPPSSCRLRLSNAKIKDPRRVDGKLQGDPTLTALATCSRSERLMLSGSISVTTKPRHTPAGSRHYTLAAIHTNARANSATKITIRLPRPVEAALGANDTISGTFTLADSTGKKLATIVVRRISS